MSLTQVQKLIQKKIRTTLQDAPRLDHRLVVWDIVSTLHACQARVRGPPTPTNCPRLSPPPGPRPRNRPPSSAAPQAGCQSTKRRQHATDKYHPRAAFSPRWVACQFHLNTARATRDPDNTLHSAAGLPSLQPPAHHKPDTVTRQKPPRYRQSLKAGRCGASGRGQLRPGRPLTHIPGARHSTRPPGEPQAQPLLASAFRLGSARAAWLT